MSTSRHSFDWLSYVRRDEISEQEMLRAGEHLKTCAACRRQVEDLRILEQRLGEFECAPMPSDFIKETALLIERNRSGSKPAGRLSMSRLGGWWRTPLPRRAALVAGTVLFTMLLQWTVWNPIPGNPVLHTVFAFSETPPASLGGLPGLHLEAHQDGRFSSNLFEERLSPSEIARLLRGRGMEFGSLTLWAPKHLPVQIDLEKLSPITEAFGIHVFHLTGSVQGLLHQETGSPDFNIGLRDASGTVSNLKDWLQGLKRLESAPELGPPLLQSPSRVYLYVKEDRLIIDRAILDPEDAGRILQEMQAVYPGATFILLDDPEVPEAQKEAWIRRLRTLKLTLSIVRLKQ